MFSGDSNIAELVGNHDGSVLVDVFDWVAWLGHVFKKMDNILTYQQFKMDSSNPGIVKCYRTIDSEPVIVRMLKDPQSNPKTYLTTTLPESTPPEGLSHERQQYLFKHIREFCKTGTKDYVAPPPTNKRHKN